VIKDQNQKGLDDMFEDVKNLKAEVDLLKNAVKSLGGIKQEGKAIMKSINILKEDIKQIKIENVQLARKVNTIEEEMEADADDESEDDETDKLAGNLACEYCKIHFGIRKFYENHIEQHMGKGIIKCLECLYSCENKGTFLKHMNTKHPHKRLDVTENSFEEENNEIESDSEDETSLFSIKIVNGEPVCVGNLCDE
jgi:archaellum component FlaC